MISRLQQLTCWRAPRLVCICMHVCMYVRMCMQVVNKIMYSCSSDHTARAWLKDVGHMLQVYRGNKMPISRVLYYMGIGQYWRSLYNKPAADQRRGLTRCAGGRHNTPPPYACWPFDLESVVRVTCDVAYLCANFSLPGLSVLDLGPMYATDRQTSDVHHRLMPST